MTQDEIKSACEALSLARQTIDNQRTAYLDSVREKIADVKRINGWS
jgi:hypothetical protein